MTEEIIIDCAFYKDGVCASPINKTCEYCKNIDVSKCYHKQLKSLEQDSKQLTQWLDEARRNADFWCDKCTSLEQENNELQKQNDEECLRVVNLAMENTKLEKENERLKKEVRLYDCISKWGEKECHCACRCLGNEFCEDADKKINTYRSALEDIRNYCDRIEQGSVIGTQDCLINSIKNITNRVLNDSEC